jgi:long-subunit fatty acid transport protein
MLRTLSGCLALALALIALPMTVHAQERWRVETRAGAAFTTQDLADASLDPGLGFEATIAYNLMPQLSVYAGWDWYHFTSSETSFAGADSDVEETGYAFGLRFERPFGDQTQVALRLRAGATYDHIEIEDDAGELVGDSGHGFGWEAGAGLGIQLGNRWELSPGVRYRSLTPDLDFSGATASGTLAYVAVEVGVSRSF